MKCKHKLRVITNGRSVIDQFKRLNLNLHIDYGMLISNLNFKWRLMTARTQKLFISHKNELHGYYRILSSLMCSFFLKILKYMRNLLLNGCSSFNDTRSCDLLKIIIVVELKYYAVINKLKMCIYVEYTFCKCFR